MLHARCQGARSETNPVPPLFIHLCLLRPSRASWNLRVGSSARYWSSGSDDPERSVLDQGSQSRGRGGDLSRSGVWGGLPGEVHGSELQEERARQSGKKEAQVTARAGSRCERGELPEGWRDRNVGGGTRRDERRDWVALQGQLPEGHLNTCRLDPEGSKEPGSWSQKKWRTKRS